MDKCKCSPEPFQACNCDPGKFVPLKHAKPGEKKKKKLHPSLVPPKKKHCRWCNVETGTECYRHYEGMYKHLYGKGTGVKVNDKMTVWGCMDCDDKYSQKEFEEHHHTKALREISWLKGIIDTWLLNT